MCNFELRRSFHTNGHLTQSRSMRKKRISDFSIPFVNNFFASLDRQRLFSGVQSSSASAYECLACGRYMLDVADVGTHRGVCPEKAFQNKLGDDFAVILCCNICNVFVSEERDDVMGCHLNEAHRISCRDMWKGNHLRTIVFRPDKRPREEKEDPDYLPPAKRDIAEDSDSEEEENTEVESLSPTGNCEQEPETSTTATTRTGRETLFCKFCGRSYSSLFGMKKHFRTVHGVSDERIVNVVQKMHLMEASGKPGKRFLCLECLMIVNQQHKHRADHKENLLKVTKMEELPVEILQNFYEKEEESAVESLRVHRGIDFKRAVLAYKEKKLKQVKDGSEKTWREDNCEQKVSRLAEMLKESVYLTDFNKLENWLLSHEKLKTGKTYQSNLNELQQFVERFLECKVDYYQKLPLPVIKANLRSMKKAFSKTVKERTLAEQYVAEMELPEVGDIATMQTKARELIQQWLAEDLDVLKEGHSFRHLQYALMALVVFQNACRNGPVLTLKPEHFVEVFYDPNLNLYGITQAPRLMKEIPKVGTRSDFINKIQMDLSASNKEFHVYGINRLVVDPRDFTFFGPYMQIRKELGFADDSFLFAATVENQYDYHLNYNKMKNWTDVLPKLINCKISGTAVRKMITSYISENARDSAALPAVDRHLGHSAETSKKYYQIKTGKMADAMLTGNMIREAYRREHPDTHPSLPPIPESLPIESGSHQPSGSSDYVQSPSSSTDRNELTRGKQLVDSVEDFLKNQESRDSGRKSSISPADFKFIAQLFVLTKKPSLKLNVSDFVRKKKPELSNAEFKTFYEGVRSKLKQLDKHFFN